MNIKKEFNKEETTNKRHKEIDYSMGPPRKKYITKSSSISIAANNILTNEP